MSILKKISTFKTLGTIFLLALLFVLGGTIWAYVALSAAGETVILHFNSVRGITQIGSPVHLLWVGLTAMVAVFINFFICLELETRDKFLAKLLAIATLLWGLLIFIGFAAIISVN